jgi:hypothetical protein
MSRRRRKPVEKKVRLYPGQNPDDALIHWLKQFEGKPYGVESNAIKEALYRGISGDGGQLAAASAGVDLAEIRQVVESAITQGLARFEGQIGGAAVSGSGDEEDAEAEALLDNLKMALVLSDDDDD